MDDKTLRLLEENIKKWCGRKIKNKILNLFFWKQNTLGAKCYTRCDPDRVAS